LNRVASFPLPDEVAAPYLEGTELVCSVVLQTRDYFQSVPAVPAGPTSLLVVLLLLSWSLLILTSPVGTSLQRVLGFVRYPSTGRTVAF
jgi:hypothetical protein